MHGAQDRNVDLVTWAHSERLRRIGGCCTSLERDSLRSIISTSTIAYAQRKRDSQFSLVLCFWTWSHYKDTVLTLQPHPYVWGDAFWHESGGADTQLHVETILYFLSGPLCGVATGR